VAKLIEVKVGQIWRARVSGNFVDVEVIAIHKPDNYGGRRQKTKLTLHNLKTKRQIERTPAFLRRKVANSRVEGNIRVTPKAALDIRIQELPNCLGFAGER